jgi:hypothetical protein
LREFIQQPPGLCGLEDRALCLIDMACDAMRQQPDRLGAGDHRVHADEDTSFDGPVETVFISGGSGGFKEIFPNRACDLMQSNCRANYQIFIQQVMGYFNGFRVRLS